MRKLIILLLGASLLPGNVQAQVLDPVNRGCYVRDKSLPFVSRMTFTMRTAGRMRIMIASGGFDIDATARFNAFLPQAGRVDEIWLDSPGGVATQGIELGKAIRHAGIPTRVPTGFSCISACTMAFLGGPFRSLDAYSNYGIHAAYNDRFLLKYAKSTSGNGIDKFNELHDREVTYQQLGAQMQSYAARMGISSKFIADVMLSQKSIEATADGHLRSLYRCISISEAQRYNVVNQ